MAPEVLKAGPYGTSADVYAFGIVIAELLSRRCPYEECPTLEGVALALKVVEGLRPQLPAGSDPRLAALAAECWAPDPRARPGAAAVAGRLEGA